MKTELTFDDGRCRPIPMPIPAPNIRERIVETNLINTLVTWKVRRWDPTWTNQWSDLFKVITITFTGHIRAVIEGVNYTHFLVELENGQLIRVNMYDVKILKE